MSSCNTRICLSILCILLFFLTKKAKFNKLLNDMDTNFGSKQISRTFSEGDRDLLKWMERIFDFNHADIHKPKFSIICKGCNQAMVFFWRNRRQPLARHLKTQRHKELAKDTNYSNISLDGLNGVDTPTASNSISYVNGDENEDDVDESESDGTSSSQSEPIIETSMNVAQQPTQIIRSKNELTRIRQEFRIFKAEFEVLQKDKQFFTQQNDALKNHLDEYKQLLQSNTILFKDELEKSHVDQRECEKKYAQAKIELKLLKGENEAFKEEIDRLSKENYRLKVNTRTNTNNNSTQDSNLFNLITKFFDQIQSDFEINTLNVDQMRSLQTSNNKLQHIEDHLSTLRCCLITRFKEKDDLLKQSKTNHLSKQQVESNGTPLTPDEIKEFKEKHLNSFITRITKATATKNGNTKRSVDDNDESQTSMSSFESAKRAYIEIQDDE